MEYDFKKLKIVLAFHISIENYTKAFKSNCFVLKVRFLDLSYNQLPASPTSAWFNMKQLDFLSLKGNPITKFTNESFNGLKYISKLDISQIEANSFQVTKVYLHVKVALD